MTISVNDKEFSWVMNLKEKLAVSIKENLWLLSSHEPTSGILGLVNCLRREPEGERIRYNKETNVIIYFFTASITCLKYN